MSDPKYPRGFARADDEGAFQLRIANDGKTVIIDFGKPMRWIGLGPEEAEGAAELLKKHAAEIRANPKPKE